MSETRLTPSRREELARLCEAATAGPWSAENRHSDFGPCYNTVRTPKGLLCDDYGIDLLMDAEFIAAARTALPEALAEVDRLTARWEALKADATALHGPALRISEQEGGDSATALGVLWLGKAIAYETMLGAMSRLEQTP